MNTNIINNSVDCSGVSICAGKTLKGSADVFVVPNKMGVIDNCYFDSIKDWIKSIANVNGISVDSTDKMVEVWITGKWSDNLNDHGMLSKSGDRITCRCNIIPAKLFDGKVEGDTVEVKFPAIWWTAAGDGIDIILKLQLKLAQTKYRYARFGNFEEALDYATR